MERVGGRIELQPETERRIQKSGGLKFMIHTSLEIIRPTLQAVPLALIFTSRLLLTEKSSITGDGDLSGSSEASRTIRATLVTPVLKGVQGYRHGGIND